MNPNTLQACERVSKYLDERSKIRGLDPERISGFHEGHEREACLMASDLRLLIAALAEDALQATIEPVSGNAEPVAWRWRLKDAAQWIYNPLPAWVEEHRSDDAIVIEPLYASPPVAPPAAIDSLGVSPSGPGSLVASLPAIPNANTERHDEAQQHALMLAKALHDKHYSEVTQWVPCTDTLGLLLQIDNMVSGLVKRPACDPRGNQASREGSQRDSGETPKEARPAGQEPGDRQVTRPGDVAAPLAQSEPVMPPPLTTEDQK